MNIEEIINSYGSYIYNYALKLTCHPVDAEDVAQETFIKAWSNIHTLKNENAIKPWLRKICFNLFLNRKTKNQTKVKGLLYHAHINLDSFFAGHCNIIDVKNPCSCKAWIDFANKRDTMQATVKDKKHKLIDHLDYKGAGYKFNDSVRGKVNFLYKNMPDKKPSNEWYERVITSLSHMYS